PLGEPARRGGVVPGGVPHQRLEPGRQHPEPVAAPAAREPGGLLLGAIVEQLREQQPSLELAQVVLVADGIGRWGHERQLERRVTRCVAIGMQDLLGGHGHRRTVGLPPGCVVAYQRTKSAPARYGKISVSRSQRDAWAKAGMRRCCAIVATRASQKLGSCSRRCSGIITSVCTSVAWPSSTACAALRRSFACFNSRSESRFPYWPCRACTSSWVTLVRTMNESMSVGTYSVFESGSK